MDLAFDDHGVDHAAHIVAGREIDDLDDALKTSANRIALGFISGALIVGSSLIIAAKGPGKSSHLGTLGFVFAAIIAAYVAYGIYKEGRR